MMRTHTQYLVLTSFVLALGTGQKAPAQAAPTATGPGTTVSLGAAAVGYHIDYGKRTLGGGQGWVDANPLWWGGVEVEYRALTYNRDLNTHASTLLAGPRLSFSSGVLEPYVKVLTGRGTFYFPYNYARGSYFVVSGGAGVDLHVGRRLQWRILDVEYQKWPHFTYGAFSSYGVSSGVSYTLYGRRDHKRSAD